MNLFEAAARGKYRFTSAKGQITTEDLFDLPLTSKNGFDLDMVARSVNNELKAASEESFVTTNRRNTELENKLEIVKFVIQLRQAEKAEAADRAERLARKRKILDAIENKENQQLSEASLDDLRQQLAEL
jgi:beta-glucosidase-like glycosyl hydrolase